MQAWQKNLSDRHVANMPWDAPQQPVSMNTPGAIMSTSSGRALASSQPLAMINTTASNHAANGKVNIKTEPSTYDLQNLPNAYVNSTALQEASRHLSEKFGNAADVQVNQLQARAAIASRMNGAKAPARPPNGQAPSSMTDEQRRANEEQRRRFFEQQQRNAQYQGQQQQRAGQTDGADEWEAMVQERRALASDESTVRQSDQTFRRHIEEMSKQMEGGGLMKPLSKKRRSLQKSRNQSTNSALGRRRMQENIPGESHPAQLDGVDDSDEDIKEDPDEDAINSDLDDPNDDVVEDEEEDANAGEIMLCTYDKVQRVKNKWKCVFRDGILTTGGHEYVISILAFHGSSSDMPQISLQQSYCRSRVVMTRGGGWIDDLGKPRATIIRSSLVNWPLPKSQQLALHLSDSRGSPRKARNDGENFRGKESAAEYSSEMRSMLLAMMKQQCWRSLRVQRDMSISRP